MFHGGYGFFDYKYNIAGYAGQDFGGFAQKLFLILSLIMTVITLVLLRKSSKEKTHKIIKFISLFLVLFYIIKTVWESYYDIKYTGSFNYGLLPLDTCSIVMYAGLISSFCKGNIHKYSDAWLVTGGIVGGIANMVIMNAFKYYPFLSFGAFYSMIWHLLMVILGLIMLSSNYVNASFDVLKKGFIFHFAFSIFVIIFDFVYKYDFMLYRELGGIPIFESIASKLTDANLQFLNPIMMLLLYIVAFSIVLAPFYIKNKLSSKNK